MARCASRFSLLVAASLAVVLGLLLGLATDAGRPYAGFFAAPDYRVFPVDPAARTAGLRQGGTAGGRPRGARAGRAAGRPRGRRRRRLSAQARRARPRGYRARPLRHRARRAALDCRDRPAAAELEAPGGTPRPPSS